MDGDRTAYALYLILFLVLVASSLASRRLPVGKTLKMAAAWVAIFAIGFAIFSFRSEFRALGSRLKAEAIGSPIQSGEELRIPMADDGHFWVQASVNGHEMPFMVDSGASITVISKGTADEAGIATGIRVAEVDTANGTVIMHRAYADQFQVGQISRAEFPVLVNSHDGANVLGMNFLSSLGSWRVEGHYLVLRP
jgi:aspartyl protease family protein